MRQKIVLLIAAAGILLTVAYVITPDGSVAWNTFEPRFEAVVSNAGFRIVSIETCGADKVPLPLHIRGHPRHWHFNSDIQVATGFPDSGLHYILQTSGSPLLDCFVRYLDSRARLIAIRASTSQEAAARATQAALRREFPWLAITVTIQDD